MANAKDKYPQMGLRFKKLQTGVDTFSEVKIPVPVVQDLGGKALVVELLKLLITMPAGSLLDGDSIEIAVYDRERTSMPDLDDSGVLYFDRFLTQLTTEGSSQLRETIVIDYSDGNGRGVLYGKKDMFAGIDSNSQGAARTVSGAWVYRLVEVGATELIGLIAD